MGTFFFFLVFWPLSPLFPFFALCQMLLSLFLLLPPSPCSLAFPCSALLLKILPFTLSQEAPSTSSPLTTPVSRWHSVILFFSSQYVLLPQRWREQETVCLRVWGVKQAYIKREIGQMTTSAKQILTYCT